MSTVHKIIECLGLKPLASEGGFYRETYRSNDLIPQSIFAGRYHADKSAATAIYYLLTPETCSALHRLPTDEVFHLYAGGPIVMLQLLPDGMSRTVEIGVDLEVGQQPQIVVPAGTWQGSFLKEGAEYGLMGTTMAPGFDFADYEGGDREGLIRQYPDWKELIERLTHPTK